MCSWLRFQPPTALLLRGADTKLSVGCDQGGWSVKAAMETLDTDGRWVGTLTLQVAFSLLSARSGWPGTGTHTYIQLVFRFFSM